MPLLFLPPECGQARCRVTRTEGGSSHNAFNRLSRVLFGGHVALVAFSTLAMVTVLNGPPGAWATGEPNATVMRVGWKYSGATYVVLGAIAALTHAVGRIGARRAVMMMLAASTITLGAELLGTATGLPFGEYHYSGLLGYRIGGLVPFPIPISWFYMLYACLAMCGRLVPPADSSRAKWRWALIAAVFLVAWDVSMDPAMVSTAHWTWGAGQQFRDAGLPSWLVAFFTRDVFYGMPLSNWGGWFLTGLVVSRVMLAVVPPSLFAVRVSPSRFPVALYVTNGIMPVVLCFRDGLVWAGVLGALAMAIPVVLSLRPAARAAVTGPARGAEPAVP